MIVLGIDPGTSCGWALRGSAGVIASGVWDLKPRRHEGGGMRYLRLRSYLQEIHASGAFDVLAYEEVRRHAGTDAAHVYGGIVATLAAWCEERQIPYQGLPVGAVKKLAAGKGNANKEAMIASASARWPAIAIEDDNHADALWIAELAFRDLPSSAGGTAPSPLAAPPLDTPQHLMSSRATGASTAVYPAEAGSLGKDNDA